jgi:retron-type reverse transcriptase
MRYVNRMFKSGVLTEGDLKISDEGVPQGSICSPVLSNITQQGERMDKTGRNAATTKGNMENLQGKIEGTYPILWRVSQLRSGKHFPAGSNRDRI